MAMFIGILFAVIPAMALLYRMLHRFEGFFDEKRLFKFLLIGMLVGSVVTVVEVVFLRFHEPFRLQSATWRAGFITLIATYPLIEGAAKTAILNWHTLAGRPDTPYYGVAVGLGFGASSTFMLVGLAYAFLLSSAEVALLSHVELIVFGTLMFTLFVGGIGFNAIAGVQIAKATAERDLLRALGIGTALALPFYTAYYVFWSASTVVGRFSAPIILVLVAVWALDRFGQQALEGIVPDELARQVRRDLRKSGRDAP